MMGGLGGGLAGLNPSSVVGPIRRIAGSGAGMTRLKDWGVTGWSNTWTALDDSDDETSPGLGGYGVQRVVDPGVVYVEQPSLDGVPRWVAKAGSQRRIFEMAWSEDRVPQTVSLVDMHATISSRRGSLEDDDPALAALDSAIMVLVTTVERLHAAQHTVGFVQPDSVRFAVRHDGSRSLMLLDLGFAWDDRGGLLEPEWLAKTPLELLFDRGSRLRNTEYLARLKAPVDKQDLRTRAREFAGPQAEDVRIIARLIAVALAGPDEVQRWCGAAKSLLKLPSRDIAPDTEAAIWDKVIAPALDGKVTSCSELRIRLEATKPSEHFLFKPPAPPWAGWAVLRQVAVGVACLAVVAALWVLKPHIEHWLGLDVVAAPFCSKVPKADPLYEMLVELRNKLDNANTDEESRKGYWEHLKACRARHVDFKACTDDCLRDPETAYLGMVEEDARKVLDGLRVRPRPVDQEKQDIGRILANIDEFSQEVKQPPPAAVVMKLKRQLQLRGGQATGGERGPGAKP
jgi:hypothetical protein